MGIFDWLTGNGNAEQQSGAPAVKSAQTPMQPPARATGGVGVPGSYDAIHQQAIDAVQAGLRSGVRRMEVSVFSAVAGRPHAQ